MRLKDKVAVVTGAGRGIGKGIALAYAREGARVVAAARTVEEIRAVADEARSLAGDAIAIPTDVGVESDIRRMIDQTVETFGRLDILVNNAGVLGPIGPLHELDDQGWEVVIRVNLKAVFWGTRAALEVMLPRKYGRIINISSISGKEPLPLRSAYSAAKHGVIGFTRSVAMEVAREGITVNSICPGFTNTRMIDDSMPIVAPMLGMTPDEVIQMYVASIPIGRQLEIDDFAGLSVYLASDESAAMTGQAITLSGGSLMV